jgi:carboxymethylenebutenolidase
MSLLVETTTLASPRGAIAAHHASPAAPRAGLVLVQEIFGVNAHIRALAERWATHGYEVLAPAIFDRLEPGFEVGYTPEDLARARAVLARHVFDDAVADVADAAAALRARGHAQVGVVGFCYGGAIAWGAAASGAVDAAVAYYGRLIHAHKDRAPRCPTLLHFGARDVSIPLAWVDELRAAYPTIPTHVYEAGHGFACDQRADFDAASRDLAEARTREFFAAQLGVGP